MQRTTRNAMTWVAAAALAACAPVASVESLAGPAPAVAATPLAPLLEGFGAHRMNISAGNDAARRHFDQGLAHVYAFNHGEAVRSFKAAAQLDARCAICAWGVALALGPNINNSKRGDLTEARRFVEQARERQAATSPRERALIDALALRFAEAGAASADVKKEPPQYLCTGSRDGTPPHPGDVAYARAMAEVARAHPQDADVTTLYAESLMMLSPWNWWDKKTGAPRGAISDAVAALEAGLRASPDHPGLNHYLIHALEQSREPERALPAVQRLPRIAPGAAHLVHMPSHIQVRLGRFDDAARANQDALAADARMRDAIKTQGLDAKANWDVHHLHFLWFAASMQGRGEVALDAARRLATLAVRGESASSDYMRVLPWLTQVRFARWQDILGAGAAAADERSAFERGVRRYVRGVALARTGGAQRARPELAALEATASDPALAGRKVFGEDAQQTLLQLAAASLRGEIALAERRFDVAVAELKRAVTMEDALAMDEPPGWGGNAGPALAAALLLAGRAAEAEAAAQGDLARHPGNGWALQVLAESLRRQGKVSQAEQTQQAFERAWARADVSRPDGRW
jgi:tetratricopeptide (TPR) repeat protein